MLRQHFTTIMTKSKTSAKEESSTLSLASEEIPKNFGTRQNSNRFQTLDLSKQRVAQSSLNFCPTLTLWSFLVDISHHKFQYLPKQTIKSSSARIWIEIFTWKTIVRRQCWHTLSRSTSTPTARCSTRRPTLQFLESTVLAKATHSRRAILQSTPSPGKEQRLTQWVCTPSKLEARSWLSSFHTKRASMWLLRTLRRKALTFQWKCWKPRLLLQSQA